MKTNLNQPEEILNGTREQIIKTARKLFSEYGYLGVSMKNIADRIHLTKAALYYHFRGKITIYKAVLDDVFIDLNIIISQALNELTPDKKLRKLVKNYLDFGLNDGNFIRILTLPNPEIDLEITKYILASKKQIVKSIQPIVKEMLANRRFARKNDSQLVTLMLVNMINGLLLDSIFFKKKIDSTTMSNQIISMLF